LKVIIWADEPNNGVPVRDDLRAKGHTAMIRDARAFAGFADVERCDALAFVDASKRAFIIAEYRTPAAQERYGQVQVFDVATGDFGEPIGPLDVPADPVEPPPPSEADLLTSRTDRLSDEDLRTFVRVTTGTTPPEDASREDLESALRRAEPGQRDAPDLETIKERVRELTGGSNPPPQVPPAPPAEGPDATQADDDPPPPPPAAPEAPAGPGRRRKPAGG
jgi:hypothetical protein